jgi:serine/threonine-protein kinase
MGTVWEAVATAASERIALKFLTGAKEEDRRRFRRESRAAAAVRHPNVVSVHELLDLPDGSLVMVMELLEGESMRALVDREPRLDLPTTAAILLPVVEALSAAHAAGVVHRDLKPENVFLDRRDGSTKVKVLDFGIAKLVAADGLGAETQPLTRTGSLIGTPHYMSPEQVFGEKDLDGSSDVWSLGVILYECLAGARPTEADNVGAIFKRIVFGGIEPLAGRCPELPEDVLALVARMLVVDRHRRLRDLDEVRAILARHAGSLSSVAAAGEPDAEALASTEVSARPAHDDRVRPAPGAIGRSDGPDTHSPLTVAPARTGSVRRSVAVSGFVLAAAALVGIARLGARGAERAEPASAPAIVATQETTPPPVASSAPAPAEIAATPSASASQPAHPAPRAVRAPAARSAASSVAPPPASPPPPPAPPAPRKRELDRDYAP